MSGSTLLKLVKCSVAYSMSFNNVASILLLSPELFLIIAIMFYLCFYLCFIYVLLSFFQKLKLYVASNRQHTVDVRVLD